MIVIAIILVVIGVINLFVTGDTLMALTFITTGLLLFLNRAIYIPSGKVILGTCVTGVILSTHVDSYIYKIIGDSSYEFGFSEGLNIIWNSIFTSYPIGYEELYGSRRFFLIALAITIIFIIIDLVRGVDLTPARKTGKTYSTETSPQISESKRNFEEFNKRLKELERVYNLLKQGDENQYYEEYHRAQIDLAETCARILYDNTTQDEYITTIREFVEFKSKRYPWLRLIGPKGSAVYKWSTEDLSRCLERTQFYYGAFQCNEITFTQMKEKIIC